MIRYAIKSRQEDKSMMVWEKVASTKDNESHIKNFNDKHYYGWKGQTLKYLTKYTTYKCEFLTVYAISNYANNLSGSHQNTASFVSQM